MKSNGITATRVAIATAFACLIGICFVLAVVCFFDKDELSTRNCDSASSGESPRLDRYPDDHAPQEVDELAAIAEALSGDGDKGERSSTSAIGSSEEGAGWNAAYAHGMRQVEQMLADRPRMAVTPLRVALVESDAIWQWAARRFAGEQTGRIVYWNPEAPNKPIRYSADHRYPTDTQKGFIRVREHRADGTPWTFEALWGMVVYELINIAQGQDFHALYLQAMDCAFDKEAWIRKNTLLEHKAHLLRHEFFLDEWEPWCKAIGLQCDVARWSGEVSTDYDEWINSFMWVPTRYPLNYWGAFWDRNMARNCGAIPK